MKTVLHLSVLAAITAVLFLGCRKDICEDCITSNKPPVADAGKTQEVILPADSAVLDGTMSYDPDGTISSYQWTRIVGPASFVIRDPKAAYTKVDHLVSGSYVFELVVTDNTGLSDKATVQVNVRKDTVIITPTVCNTSSRTTYPVSYNEIGNLSVPRAPLVATAAGKIIFAGGIKAIEDTWYFVTPSAAVDIYNTNTQTWSTAQLSAAREGMASASNGNKVFFAGGADVNQVYSNVDIYDAVANTWTVVHLSQARTNLAAAAVGNKVLFAGGSTNPNITGSRVVDIYNTDTKTWSIAQLSDARYSLAAVTVGSKVYFAGGTTFEEDFKSIDIYDDATGLWSTASLKELYGALSGTTDGVNIYWATEVSNPNRNGIVEVYNTQTGTTYTECLAQPRLMPSAAFHNNQVVFYTSSDWYSFGTPQDRIDIYNTATGQWAIGLLNSPVVAAAVISVGNQLYVAGGIAPGRVLSGKVYRVSW